MIRAIVVSAACILIASCKGNRVDSEESRTAVRIEVADLIQQADSKADEFVDLWLRAKRAEVESDLRELGTKTTTTHVTGRWAKADIEKAEAARLEMESLSLALKAQAGGEGSEMIASYFRRMEIRKRIESLIDELATAENQYLVLQNLADARDELNRQRP